MHNRPTLAHFLTEVQPMFRPWGKIRWLLNRFHSPMNWVFCGCLSTEKRTLVALDYILHENSIKKLHTLSDCFFLQVNDPQSRYTNEAKKRKADFRNAAKEIFPTVSISESDLFYQNWQKEFDFFDEISRHSTKNIILDISCMPKRFFFPFIKRLYLNRNAISNLVVINTVPESYPDASKVSISEDYEDGNNLPLFPGKRLSEENTDEYSRYKNVLLGIGHLPMRILEQAEEIGSSSNVHLYFPFPGSVSSLEPTWNFAHKIEDQIPSTTGKIHITRISANDTSKQYSFLERDTNYGKEYSIILPYGPKPFSLAMALFACKYEQHPVFYTQPRVYYPDYSLGIRQENNEPVIHAYTIIANEKFYYW